uniref:Uncharacterized protein n=1 Tax=Oryza sativa subsp. japonica TaxID=39947 RepID=Q6H4B2_ORYSJ|nr:hypothetical protein [Oryza sativa Japonica Group]BAD26437.1 hypothetical protein [Oryza sativa Japonica Group]
MATATTSGVARGSGSGRQVVGSAARTLALRLGVSADLVPPWRPSRSPSRRCRDISANRFGAELANHSANAVGANLGYLEYAWASSSPPLLSTPLLSPCLGCLRRMMSAMPLSSCLHREPEIPPPLCDFVEWIDKEMTEFHKGMIQSWRERQEEREERQRQRAAKEKAERERRGVGVKRVG